MKSKLLLIGLILLIAVSISLVVIPICMNASKTDEEVTDNPNEDSGKEPSIPDIKDPVCPDGDTVIVDPDEEDEEKEDTESDEPPIGDNNINLDVSENLPPIKNPDPSASADEVIYGTKGVTDGK